MDPVLTRLRLLRTDDLRGVAAGGGGGGAAGRATEDLRFLLVDARRVDDRRLIDLRARERARDRRGPVVVDEEEVAEEEEGLLEGLIDFLFLRPAELFLRIELRPLRLLDLCLFTDFLGITFLFWLQC